MKVRIYIILLVLTCFNSRAQNYVITLRNWGVKEGLSHRQVSQVFIDRRGLVWLSTPNGLNRFDGRTFKWYTKENSSLPFNDISRILVEYDTNTFVIEEEVTHRCALFNPNTGYCKVPVDQMGGNEHIKMTDSLRSWRIYTKFKRWQQYNGRTFFTEHDSVHRFYIFGNGELKKVPFPFATDCLLDGEYFLLINNCKVPADEYRLYLCSIDGIIQRKLLLPGKVINYTADYLHRGVVINISGKNYYVDSSFKLIDLHNSYLFNYDAFYVGHDDLYFTQGVVFHANGKIERDFQKENIGDFASKQRFYQADSQAGRTWIANDFGLHLLNVGPNRFKKYLYDTAFTANANRSCRAIIRWDGRLFVNEEFSGLKMQKDASENSFSDVYREIDLLNYSGNENYALCKTSNGRLLTAIGRRIIELDLNKKSFRLLNSGQFMANCWTICEIEPGYFLLGTEKGIKKLDLRGPNPIITPKDDAEYDLPGHFILYINRSRDGRIWVCSNKGLVEYSTAKGQLNQYSESGLMRSNYLPVSSVRHFYEDANGDFWLATPTGLVYWKRKSNSSQLYTRTEGLSNNSIYAVYGDKSGKIWMSSDFGIMRLNPADGHVNTYLAEDGITHNEFNRISHYQDENGIIYFGSLNGITAFNPADFNDDVQGGKANIVVTDFYQFDGVANKLVNRTDSLLRSNEIVMEPEARFFTLDFELLNYLDPTNTVYFWKIEGIDSGWTSTKEHTLMLSRLPYGKWTLRIKAQGADGLWSANQLAITLRVVKPFYLTAGFLIVAVLLVYGCAFLFFRYRTRRLAGRNRLLQKAIDERTKELQESLIQKDTLIGEKEVLLKEIHHRVKNNLQVISALLYLQGNSLKDENARSAIVESTGRVKSISLIHQQLYQTDEMSSIDLNKLLTDLFTQVELLFNMPKNHILLSNKISTLRFDIDTAVPLGLILNELLTNSFKYAFTDTKSGSIEVALKQISVNNFLLTYRDSGPGLPPGDSKTRGKSLGLRMVNRLSKQLGGRCMYSDTEHIFIIEFLDEAGRKLKD